MRGLESENGTLKKLLAEVERVRSIGHRGSEGSVVKKRVKPTARRSAVGYLMEERGFSQRRACRLVGLARSVAQYRLRPRGDEALRTRLKDLAARFRRYGDVRPHVRLASEGLVVNRKRTYRLYREEGLQGRRRKRRRIPRRDRVPRPAPDRPMQRWSLDFVSDQLASGRRFRVLDIVDDHSRECPGQIVDTSISGVRLAWFLDKQARRRGLPRQLVMDNGPELTSRALFEWSRRTGVELHYIDPPARQGMLCMSERG